MVSGSFGLERADSRRVERITEENRFRAGSNSEVEEMNFYVGMIELEADIIKEAQGMRIVAAMEEMKSACAGVGFCEFYQVSNYDLFKEQLADMRKQAGR